MDPLFLSRSIRAWNIDNICHVAEERSIVNDATMSSLRAADFQPTGATEEALRGRGGGDSGGEAGDSSGNKGSDGIDTPPPPPASTGAAKKPAAPAKASTAGAASGPVTGPAPVSNSQMQKLAAMSYNDYVLGHEQILEHYSEIASLEETQQYLYRNGHILLHEHAQSYMLLSCLEDEMNGKHKRMKLVGGGGEGCGTALHGLT